MVLCRAWQEERREDMLAVTQIRNLVWEPQSANAYQSQQADEGGWARKLWARASSWLWGGAPAPSRNGTGAEGVRQQLGLRAHGAKETARASSASAHVADAVDGVEVAYRERLVFVGSEQTKPMLSAEAAHAGSSSTPTEAEARPVSKQSLGLTVGALCPSYSPRQLLVPVALRPAPCAQPLPADRPAPCALRPAPCALRPAPCLPLIG